MFTVQLTSYGQTLVSSLVNIDGIILLYDTIADISSVTSTSSYTVQLDEEACGNLNKNVGNVKVQDSRSDEYIAKTILFYVLNGSEKKIVAGYSQDAPIIQKSGSPLTVFLSFDFSVFTNGFLFSSIQAGYGNAAHNTDGIVHIENPEISADDAFSVYNKAQVDALLSNKQASLEAGDGIAITNDIIRTTGIPFGICNNTSTATAFTVTVPGIYKLEDGVCCLIKNSVVTSASGFTLNVNGLGGKPCYSNMAAATRETTIFNVNYTMLFVYDSTRVDGGCWICYRGYYSDANSIAYQVRGNVHTLPTTEKFYRYRLLFTSADGTHFVPSNTSTSTNATSLREVNQTPIDPFGEIVYYSTTAAVEANANPGPTYLWTQYAIAFGYSFNRSGAALTLTSFAPVYIKCEPQSNGSAIIDADTPYVQSLPNNADGNIYIFLGIANNATSVELLNNHPVYYHDGTAIRIWHGKDSYTKDEIDSIVSDYVQSSLTINDKPLTSDITLTLDDISDGNSRVIPTNVSQLNNDAGYLTSYTETDPTVPNWAKQPSKPTYTAAEVGALPDTTVIPAVYNATLTIKKNNSDTGDTFTANASQNKTINLGLASVATTGSYNDLANKPSIPTDTSDLTNGAGFITSADVPTKVSELTNDAGYIITETDPTVPAWAKNQNKPTYNLDEVTDGSTRKLPTKTSQLTNDSNFLTSHQSIKTINNQSLIGTGNVTIATGENNVIESISVNNTAQTVTNKNVNITVPTKTSDITNDSGFITSANIPSDVSAFNNDAGYITTESDPTVPSWAKQTNKPSYNLDEVIDGTTRKLSNYVPTSRKINNKALSSDITLNLDDVLDGSTRKLNNYVPYSEVISTINGFDNRRLWQYEIHNTLWAANKRYDVTLTGFTNNNASASLFDGSFETNVVVPKEGTGTILISGKNGSKMWSGGYPYGYLEVAFYYTSVPESVTCRVYSDWAQNPGWHNVTLTNVCKNSNQALYRGVNTGFYGVTQMEITINAKDSVTANVTEVAFYQTRGTLQQMAVFNKTVAQTLYHDLTGTKFIVSGGTSSQFLKADGSLDSNTYITSASIPTNVSAFTNDAGYLTSSALTPYELKANLKEGAYVNVDETTMTSTSTNLPTAKAVASYISGLNYITSADIPTNISAFTNDAGYLTSHQSLSGVVASAQYNATTKKIEFYNSSNTKLNTDIDASAFIKDGMVDTVEISNGKLVISFNTDAGKEDIEISISDIFNASNYYTKSETNTQISSAISALNLGTASTKNYSADMNTDANLPTTAAIKSYITNKNFATVSQIPTTTSQLTNNSGFITSSDIPTNVSTFTNDSGYITSDALTPYELKTNLKEGAYINVDETTMTSSSTNLPTSKAVASYISNQGFATVSQIPDSTSDLTNDSGFITSADIPNNVSSFTNDAGYLVSSDLPTNHATTDTAQEITGTKTIAESKLKIGNTSSSEDIDNFVFKRGQEFIVGTQTSSTSLWKGNTTQESIYEGMCINYFVPVASTSTAITLELTLPNGTTTGAIPVRRNAGSTATSSHIGVGSVVQLTLLLNRTVGSALYEKVWRMNEWYDSNTNTIGYQLRTNSTVMNVSDTARYYKLYFTSANGNLWVPASVNSTNDATTARAVNQRPINPFGRIVYTSANTNYAAGANLAAATIWDQYNLALGYSFNVNGGTLALTVEKPVYVKCAPQIDGSAIIDSATPTVQDLPTSNDGKIYIFLGTATSATAVELFQNHPVYYHDGNGIKLWSGVVLPSKTSDLTNDSGFITSSDIPTNVSELNNDAGYITGYTETDPTVPSWAKQSTKPSYTASEVGALPDTTVIPTKTTARGDGKYLYNGQSVDIVADNIGFSSTTNLINTSGVTAYVAIRANSSNPFLGLKEGSNLWYAQAASNYFYFGPTSAKALRLDQAGNGVFQTGTCTAKGFKYQNGSTTGTDSQVLVANGTVNTLKTVNNESLLGTGNITVPTNTNQLTNGAGFITSSDIPTNISSFTNDAGYLVSSDLPTNHVTTDTNQTISGSKSVTSLVHLVGRHNSTTHGGLKFSDSSNSTTFTEIASATSEASSRQASVFLKFYSNSSYVASLDTIFTDSSSGLSIELEPSADNICYIGGTNRLSNVYTHKLGSSATYTDSAYITDIYTTKSSFTDSTSNFTSIIEQSGYNFLVYAGGAAGSIRIGSQDQDGIAGSIKLTGYELELDCNSSNIYNVLPKTASCANLGSDSKPFDYVYTNNINSTSIIATQATIDEVSGSFELKSTDFIRFFKGATNFYTKITQGQYDTCSRLFISGYEATNDTLQSSLVISNSSDPNKESSILPSVGTWNLGAVGTYFNSAYITDIYGTSFSGNSATATFATSATSATYATYIRYASSGSTYQMYASSATVLRPTNGSSVDIGTSTYKYNNIYAVTFNGDLAGNATSATNATHAADVAVTVYNEDTNYPIVITDTGGATYKNLAKGTATYNPSTNTLTCNTFSGSLSGNATSATSATNAANVGILGNSTASSYPLVFTNSVNTSTTSAVNKKLYTDTANALSYNPSTNVLSGLFAIPHGSATLSDSTWTVSSVTPNPTASTDPPTGAVVSVYFGSYNSVENPQLKFGSWNAKPIYRLASYAGTGAVNSWLGGSTVLLRYNGSNWRLLNNNSYPTSTASGTTNIIPSTDNTYDLGSSSYRWNNLYAYYVGDSSTKVQYGYFNYCSISTLRNGSNSNLATLTSAGIIPYTDSDSSSTGFDLGSSTKKWKSLYISGGHDSKYIIVDHSGGEPTIRPDTPNYGYLGTSSADWYRIYGRQIHVGSNHVLIPPIAATSNTSLGSIQFLRVAIPANTTTGIISAGAALSSSSYTLMLVTASTGYSYLYFRNNTAPSGTWTTLTDMYYYNTGTSTVYTYVLAYKSA